MRKLDTEMCDAIAANSKRLTDIERRLIEITTLDLNNPTVLLGIPLVAELLEIAVTEYRGGGHNMAEHKPIPPEWMPWFYPEDH